MKSLEKKEIILLVLQFVGIIMLYIFSNVFWFLFALNLALLVFSIFWIFDIKPSVAEVKKKYHYILMPLLYFIGIIFFMTSIKNVILQVIILGLYVISNHFFIEHMTHIQEGSEDCSTTSRNIVSMILLVIVFLSITDLINAYIFFKIPLFILLLFSFAVIWLVTRFLFYQYDILDKKSALHVFLISFSVMEIVWVGSFWLVNYPVSKIGEMGIPMIAILILVFYYTIWGLSQHKLTNTLTKKVLTEYIMISLIIVSILLLTVKWIPEGVIS